MDGIQRISGQRYLSASAAAAAGPAKEPVPQQTADIYVPGGAETASPAKDPKPLTGALAASLGQSYDVTHMTRDQYTEVLYALRNAKVITQREFSMGYYSAPTIKGWEHREPWPAGERRGDFTVLLQTAKTLDNDPAYARLAQIFDALRQVRGGEEAGQEGDPEMNTTIHTVYQTTGAAVPPKSEKPAAAGSFQAMLDAAAKAQAAPELPDFTGMSDYQKLAALRKLHNATDYSGMSVLERYKLVNDRIEAAFPNMMSLRSGIYGSYVVDLNNPNRPKSLHELVSDEYNLQWEEAGLDGRIHKGSVLRREAYYSGMTDQEVIAAVTKRHGSTIAGRAGALYELHYLKLDNGVGLETVTNMRIRLVQEVKGARGYAGTNVDNPLQTVRLAALADGRQIGWGTFGQTALKAMLESGYRPGDAAYQEYQQGLEELLDTLMKTGT